MVKQEIAALDAAVRKFREGLSDQELEEIIADMNSEYVEPEDSSLVDWVDDLPEDEC